MKKLKIRVPVLIEKEIEIELKDDANIVDYIWHYLEMKKCVWIEKAKDISMTLLSNPKKNIDIKKLISVIVEKDGKEIEKYDYDTMESAVIVSLDGDDEDERNFNRMIYCLAN